MVTANRGDTTTNYIKMPPKANAAKTTADLGVGVTPFSGEVGSQDVRAFVAQIDQLKELFRGQYDDAWIAQICISKLTGYAKSPWLDAMRDELEPFPNINIWEPPANEEGQLGEGGLKAALLRHFAPKPRSLAALQKDMLTLEQNPGESIENFNIRVRVALSGWLRKAIPDHVNPEDEVYLALKAALISEGLRRPVREYLQAQRPTPQTAKDIIECATDFQNTDAGTRELGAGMPSRRVAAMEAENPEKGHSNKEHQGQPTVAATAKANSKKGLFCDYCGLVDSHIKKDCYRRKNDEAKGIFRERHDPFPAVPKGNFNKKKKNNNKQKPKQGEKAVSAAASTPNPPTPTYAEAVQGQHLQPQVQQIQQHTPYQPPPLPLEWIPNNEYQAKMAAAAIAAGSMRQFNPADTLNYYNQGNF